MQFLVIGTDAKDKGAKERRALARKAHITLGDKLLAAGHMWYGAALLHEDGTPKGSMLMMDFPSEFELKQWLTSEPYAKNKVWKTIEIHKCKTRDPWKFSRPKEFFDSRK